MADTLQMKTSFSTTTSYTDNFCRFLFTQYLNTGVLDAYMKSKESLSGNHWEVGEFIRLNCGMDLLNMFLYWARQNPLSAAMLDNGLEKSINEVLSSDCRFREPFDTILGTRWKELTGYYRKKMPKDLKKSFFNKARTRIRIINEGLDKYNKQVNFSNTSGWNNGDSGYFAKTLRGWIEFALKSDKYIVGDYSNNGPNVAKALREIRNFYNKIRAFDEEPLDDVVNQLMDEVSVIEVQTQ